eukprot:scaffold91831_cov34-Prasinocladus_malaysianus.AAC.1
MSTARLSIACSSTLMSPDLVTLQAELTASEKCLALQGRAGRSNAFTASARQGSSPTPGEELAGEALDPDLDGLGCHVQRKRLNIEPDPRQLGALCVDIGDRGDGIHESGGWAGPGVDLEGAAAAKGDVLELVSERVGDPAGDLVAFSCQDRDEVGRADRVVFLEGFGVV